MNVVIYQKCSRTVASSIGFPFKAVKIALLCCSLTIFSQATKKLSVFSVIPCSFLGDTVCPKITYSSGRIKTSLFVEQPRTLQGTSIIHDDK